MILFASCSYENPNLKRQSAIANSIDAQQYELQYLGDFEHLDTVTNILHDSISLNLAENVRETFSSFAKDANNLESLFDEGSHDIKISKLNSSQKAAYDKSISSLVKFYDAYNALVEHTIKFRPIPTHYSSFSIDKKSVFGYQGFAFFDSDNNLLSRKLIHNEDYKSLSSFILHAKSADFSFLTDTISGLLFFPGFRVPSNKLDFVNYLNDGNSIIHINRCVLEPYVPTNNNDAISSSTYSSDFPTNANLYRVKEQCGATYTKEANKRFTKYANANDLSSIDNMVLNGEIEILNAGDIVMMIDIGFFLSQVKTKRGTLLYVDTSSITKID